MYMSSLQHNSWGIVTPPHHVVVPVGANRYDLYYLEIRNTNGNLPSGNTLSTATEVKALGGFLVASVHYDSSTGLQRIVFTSEGR